MDRPADWLRRVNAAITPKELERLEQCERREQLALKSPFARKSPWRWRPYGEESWTARIVKKLGLEHTVRSEGRPKKEADANN